MLRHQNYFATRPLQGGLPNTVNAQLFPQFLVVVSSVTVVLCFVISKIVGPDLPFEQLNISATARHYPQYIFYRGGLITCSVVSFIVWILHTWWLKEFSKAQGQPIPPTSQTVYVACLGLFFNAFSVASVNTGPEDQDLHVFFVCGAYVCTYINMFTSANNFYQFQKNGVYMNPYSYYGQIGSTVVFTLLWNFAIMDQNLYSGFVDYGAFVCITVFYYTFISDFYEYHLDYQLEDYYM